MSQSYSVIPFVINFVTSNFKFNQFRKRANNLTNKFENIKKVEV